MSDFPTLLEKAAMELAIKKQQATRLHLALNSVADGTIIGQDVINLMGIKSKINDVEQYVKDVVSETSFPCLEPEFELFDICDDCNDIIVWDECQSIGGESYGAYRHVRSGLIKCEER